MELIKTYLFKNYPIEIITSKARRNKYYTEDNITKTLDKHLGVFYEFDKKGRLIDSRTGEYILKNAKTAGKPKYKKIRGQELHELTMAPYTRSAIIKQLKEYFISNMMLADSFTEIDPYGSYFLSMRFYISHTYLNNPSKKEKGDFYSGFEDIDSHQEFYRKVLMDCLVSKININLKVEENPVGFLESDNYTIIRGFSIMCYPTKEDNVHNIEARLFKVE